MKTINIKGNSTSEFTPKMPVTVLCVNTVCNICYANFLDEEDLKIHVKTHLTEENRSRYCQFCLIIFPCLEEYARHICDVHILNLKCCKYCMRTFSDLQDVRTHEKKHVSAHKSGYTCSSCAQVFKNVIDLEAHEYSIHADSKDGVLLQGCYSLLSSFLNMKASIFLQSLGTRYVYTCACCKISTPDVEYYMQHLQDKSCRSFVCDMCCNVYKHLAGLRRHFKNNFECQNKGNSDKKLPCEKCNNLYNPELLQKHSEVCEAVKCTTCNIVFKNAGERAEHQSEAHQTVFSIKVCKYCHREYVGQLALNKHIERNHKKELHLYKYFCVYCEDIFKHPKKLFTHFSSKHRDLKPFTCKICNKTFTLRKQFTLHIKLEHSSRGTVKFDENFHVSFTNEVTPAKETVEEETKNNTVDSSELQENNEPTAPLKESMSALRDVELVMCPTETEVDQTDNDKSKSEESVKRKRRVKMKQPSANIDLTAATDSDDEPLIKVKRRMRRPRLEENCLPTGLDKSKKLKKKRLKFTCKLCQKYCYTYQNYNHHMSLHQKHGYKKCIKCTKAFRSRNELDKHLQQEHSSSKLTKALKSVLERKKHSRLQNEYHKASELSKKEMTERFLRTIKKVSDTNIGDVSVTFKPVINKQSVKNFLESFTPENLEPIFENKGKGVQLNNVVTLKKVNQPLRMSAIKLMKPKPDLGYGDVKLKEPQKYKDSITEEYVVSLKLVHSNEPPKMNFDQTLEAVADEYEEAAEALPDEDIINHQIMLDSTDQTLTSNAFKIHNLVISKKSTEEEYKGIHIAHLHTEAPYFKIVKLSDIYREQIEKKQTVEESDIQLPESIRLVNVNPLAHLLKDKQVELNKNKYKPLKKIDLKNALLKYTMIKKKTSTTPRIRKVKARSSIAEL